MEQTRCLLLIKFKKDEIKAVTDVITGMSYTHKGN